MSIDNMIEYSWRRAVGAVSSGIALAAMLYTANPQVAYAQGGRDVDVVMKDGKTVVRQKSPVPASAQPAPAAPKAAAGPAAGQQQLSSPANQQKPSAPTVQYGTSPICGTNVNVKVNDADVNLQGYQCLTSDEAKAKKIDSESGLSWKQYTSKPAETCPQDKLCYKLPEPAASAASSEPQPDPHLEKLGRIQTTLTEIDVTLRARVEADKELQKQRVEAERQLAAEPLIPFSGAYGLAEVLGGDARGLLAAYGAGAAFRVAANVDLELAGGMLYQHGDLEQRTGSNPSTERRLLPDGTTYKSIEDSTTTVTTDKPTGFFGRLRGAYQTPLHWLKAFVGTDVRGREEGETATDYQKTISLERNDQQLRAPKTIRDQKTTDSTWNAGVYTNGGVQACRQLWGPISGCLEAQGGYDWHTESPNYGGGVRLVGFE